MFVHYKAIRTTVIFLFLITGSFQCFSQLKLVPAIVSTGSTFIKNNSRTAETDTLSLPFWEDFSNYEGAPNPELWIDGSGVYINKTLALNPPTLGVATFDGATQNGGIYNTDPFASGKADTLVSKPINLGKLPSGELSTVYLSFYWQFFGNDEIPDAEDSLRLLFKNQENKWEVIDVFDRSRVSSNDTFEQVIYKLAPRFLHGSFQFKFQAFARLSGPYDAWHIDYIYLDKDRNVNDKNYFDRAIVDVPDYIFNGYSAVPINQFFANPKKYIGQTSVDINNLDAIFQPIEYTAKLVNTFDQEQLIELLNFNKEVNPILQGKERRRIYANPIDSMELDDQLDSIYMTLEFYISSGDSIQENGIDYRINDTVSTNYVLHNYYATDDGTAEFGLGLEQKGGKVAYMFVLDQPDILNRVDIYFPNIGRIQSGTAFNLMVLKKLSDSRFDLIYERENLAIDPISTFNEFQSIRLPELNVADTFYIAWEQLTTDFLSVGFDKQHDSGKRIFYNVNGSWVKNTEFKGSLMIRPYFGLESQPTALHYPIEPNREITFFPNPNHGDFKIKGRFDNFCIYNLSGKKLFESVYNKTEDEYNTGLTRPGIYIIQFRKGTISINYKMVIVN